MVVGVRNLNERYRFDRIVIFIVSGPIWKSFPANKDTIEKKAESKDDSTSLYSLSISSISCEIFQNLPPGTLEALARCGSHVALGSMWQMFPFEPRHFLFSPFNRGPQN